MNDHISTQENWSTILNVPISSLNMAQATRRIIDWASQTESRYVCVCDVHSVMKAQDNVIHMSALQQADMVTPDGTPLVWLSKFLGDRSIERVCGPDLMIDVCQSSINSQLGHYLFGGAEGVPEKLADRLIDLFPNITISGTYSPPFRSLTAEEQADIISNINASKAKFVWVGLGCPKQERWMLDNKSNLPGKILIGVGAAFDFHVGTIKRAPNWMRHNGLEWLYRLLSEPRRLWRRYLIDAPRFVWLSAKQVMAAQATKAIS